MVSTLSFPKLIFLINKHVMHFNLATFLFSTSVLLIEVLTYNEMAKGKRAHWRSTFGINKVIYVLMQKKNKIKKMASNKTFPLKIWLLIPTDVSLMINVQRNRSGVSLPGLNPGIARN